MLDPTDSHPLLTLSRPAEADLATQQHRQIMLARGLIAQMAHSLSRSGGGAQGLLVKGLAQRGAAQIEARLARNDAQQTQALTRFLQWITQAVSASDCSDAQFVAEFADAFAALMAAFPDEED